MWQSSRPLFLFAFITAMFCVGLVFCLVLCFVLFSLLFFYFISSFYIYYFYFLSTLFSRYLLVHKRVSLVVSLTYERTVCEQNHIYLLKCETTVTCILLSHECSLSAMCVLEKSDHRVLSMKRVCIQIRLQRRDAVKCASPVIRPRSRTPLLYACERH